MSGTGYAILAYVIGGALLWGFVIVLWAREYKACKAHRNHGGHS